MKIKELRRFLDAIGDDERDVVVSYLDSEYGEKVREVRALTSVNCGNVIIHAKED